MSVYSFEKTINLEKLDQELKSSSISTRYDGIQSSGDQIKILTTIELDETEYDVLEDIITNHTISQSLKQIVKQKRAEAQDFGRLIYDQFIEENIALGITHLGLTSHIRKSCREISDAILSGSLYDAILEISLLDPQTLDEQIMTAARLLSFRNKIETFLQVPLATTWNQAKTW